MLFCFYTIFTTYLLTIKNLSSILFLCRYILYEFVSIKMYNLISKYRINYLIIIIMCYLFVLHYNFQFIRTSD